MPMLYFKCECGTEHREIVPIDKTGYKLLPSGKWRFDPSAPKAEPAPKTKDCTCGKTITESPDPQAVKSFYQLNWLEN